MVVEGLIYLLIFGAVLVTNLLPAFAPPTWALLVYFRFHTSANSWSLLALGLGAAVLGRYLLAKSFAALGPRLSQRTQDNLHSAAALVEQRLSVGVMTLALFALTPISSAQLFEAAGLARAKLRPLLLAFTIGRGISYAGYIFGTGALKNVGITKTILEGVTSPWAIGVQILLIGSLVPLSRINWHRFLKKEQSA